jgi:hypothetical protein
MASNQQEYEAGNYQSQQPVKLLLTFDPIPERRDDYFQFVLGEFVPALEHLGLQMSEVWHTAYGSYPLRLAGFLAPDRETLDRIIAGQEYQDLEQQLLEYVENYSRRVVTQRRSFQF